jgi:hypothetical protein
MKTGILITTAAAMFLTRSTSSAFEGRISATLTRGGETQSFLYIIATNWLRIERTETNWPYAKDVVDRGSGAITLWFPHNRSFVRLKSVNETATSPFSGAPAMPLPSGIGPQTPSGAAVPDAPPMPASIGPTNLPGMPVPPPMSPRPAMPDRPPLPAGLPPGVGPQAGEFRGAPGMPAMPMMPPMSTESGELTATGQTTNLLGYTCSRYELKQRGEVMEIWATDRLLPFQAWLPNQPHRFGPRMIEEQWPELLKSKKLFPLLAILRFENGAERLRFEVKALTPEKIDDRDGKLFQAPADYQEIQPLPY